MRYIISLASYENKILSDSFGKICIMLQEVDQEHFAKPDERSMSEEGGKEK